MNYGRYQTVKKLAEGSMGVLYQAYDPQIDRMVALKVLRQDRLSSEEVVQRFLKEAKAIGRLSHPNIVTVFDTGQDHEDIYIAMELVQGRSLDKVITEKGMCLKEIVVFGIHVAEALAYAHQQGVVHRDIKPSNIISTPNYRVKITDFGIARFEDLTASDETRPGIVLGTPLYMSPEQISGQPVDARTDLYSLGAILYEMTTGRCPFQSNGLPALFRAICQDTPELPVRGDVSLKPEQIDKFYQVIMKCLSKSPDDRFQTGEELAKALISCLRPGKSAEAAQTTSAKASHLLTSPVTISSVLLLLAVALAVIFWPGPKQQLILDSAPAGAQVFIDGTFQGQTPLQLSLPVGKHEVRLSLARHFEWEAQIDLDEENMESLSIPLIPMGQTSQ